MSNIRTYESKKIVKSYINKTNLQLPEKTILNKIKSSIKKPKILDIGVGTGRTTVHFSKITDQYIGIDYSQNMIKVCKQRFKDQKNVSFKVIDVRNMTEFKNTSFDLVLFSYNGIDYINHHERIKVFQDINSILTKRGVFVFSTHNIKSIKKAYALRYKKNIKKTVYQLIKIILLYLLNGLPNKIIRKKWSIINDGACNFGLKTYYTNLEYQINMLKKMNFKEIELYSLKNGEKIKKENIHKITDTWVYFMCKK